MSRTTLDVATRRMTAEDEPAVLRLLTAALGAGPTGDRSHEFFAWKHRLNPFGASPGLVATHEDRVVGVRLFLRWELQTSGHRIRAVRPVDTATDPAFQGRGIFRRLTLELLEQLDSADQIDVVFNTPNTNSLPGYLKMGWQPVGVLPIRISPVHPARLARGAGAAVRGTGQGPSRGSAAAPAGAAAARPLPSCPFEPAGSLLRERGEEVAELAQSAATCTELHTPRTLEYLTWRYGRAPGLDYRSFTVESGGQLAGVGVGRLRYRGPLAEFTLAELFVRPGDHTTLRRLLRAARRSGADHVAVHTYAGSSAERAARVTGYPRVPRHGVTLVANPRRATPVNPLVQGSWGLSLGDVEVF